MDIEGDLADRAQEGVTAENDSDGQSTQAPAPGDIIESLNMVCGFIECNGGNSKMLHLVFMLENVTMDTANIEHGNAHFKDCVSDKMF